MAKSKDKYKRELSPKGKLWYPHLDKEEEYEGKSTGNLTIQVQFSDEEVELLKKKFLTILENAKTDEEFLDKNGNSKEWRHKPRISFREKDDIKIFKFKTRSTFKDSDTGEVIQKTIPIYDIHGNRLDNVNLGNGSIIKVSYTPKPYYKSEDNNGIGLWMAAIQVFELVEFKPTTGASSYGFEVEKEEEPF